MMLHERHALYADEPLATELYETAYALDSTTIDLCPSMFTPLLATISGLSPGAPGASVAAASVTSDHAGVVARPVQPGAWSSHLSRDGEPDT